MKTTTEIEKKKRIVNLVFGHNRNLGFNADRENMTHEHYEYARSFGLITSKEVRFALNN